MITQLTIRGLVQGVGFRPFVYLLAKDIGIKGTVSNSNNGVIICINSDRETCDLFISRLVNECPNVAVIHQIERIETESKETFANFSIVASSNKSNEATQVAPDIAVCAECLKDRESQTHRINYPFINCTHCGPRFSIIKDLPYDRKQTTMQSFNICMDCQKEYDDISNRRFHAQPIACNNCGPTYYATYNKAYCNNYLQILELTSQLLKEGKIIAAKGVGGYHLICDATNETSVRRLRKIKLRDSKPFAILFKDINSIKTYAKVNTLEEAELISWRRPIVLLKQKKALGLEINFGLNTLGCMLPYMPIHYDWFLHADLPALVMTSGNIGDQPIIISPDEADIVFKDKVDLIIHHDREIYNRVDDSLLQICGNKACLIRRSRGYAPEPFFANIAVEGLLAFGAEKANTFALGKGDTILQSQHIGDLKNGETYDFYTESITHYCNLFNFTAQQLVCDLHPDYLSTHVAEQIALSNNLPLVRAQHHHAHAVACMVEYGINEPVVAIVWDGTGYGADGKVWGGEFFLCTHKEYTRLSHLEYTAMPGGDKVSNEPWRMAVSYLHHYGLAIPKYFFEQVGQVKIDLIIAMIDKNINSPDTSSAGRLFDALASLLGLCYTTTRQAEAPILLEQCASDDYVSRYNIDIESDTISTRLLFQGVLNDLDENVSIADISAKIHNTLAEIILEKSKLLLDQTKTSKVILSGGCFQNKRLVEHLQILFSREGIDLFVPSKIPCNDGGIAVGQITIAASKHQQ